MYELGHSYRDWELDIRCKNGEIRTIAWSNISRDYPISGWWSWGIGVDITERKQAEEQLKILSSVVQQSVQAIATIDREGIVEYANPTFLERNNYSADQVIGKNWRSFVSQDSTLRGKYREIYDTVINKRMIWKGEVSDKAKDGKVIWRESTLFPIKNEKGTLIHSVYMSEDITERKQAEEMLQESEEKFRTLAEQSPNMIFINKGGRVVYVNKHAEELMLKYSSGGGAQYGKN